MGLALINRDHRTYPVAICDQCGEVIEDGRWALYQWKDIDGMIVEDSLAFLHKIDCRKAWEKAHDDSLSTWMSMELLYLPIYFGNNININWEEAFESASGLSRLG